MARSKSSSQWLREHFKDKYVRQAQAAGWRSRAAYKLLEIESKDNIFSGVTSIVDLGAAPGSWCQLARQHCKHATIIGLDILEIAPLPGVELIQGDFQEQSTLDNLQQHLKNDRLDLILSDMAPNLSGLTAVDIPRALYLVELARDFAVQQLSKGGTFVTKVFQGEGFDALLIDLRSQFNKVVIRKPDASRDRSREVYLVCKNKV